MSKHGIVHIEFSAKDRQAAGKFYGEIFGWKIEQLPEMNYATFDPEEGPGGGFNPLSDDDPAGTVTVYIDTDDIEATLAKIASKGGKVIRSKTEIPGIGWFGIFTDPTGNKVGLYTAKPKG